MKRLIIGAFSLLVAGCASAPTVQLSEQDKAAVRTVTIDPNVSMPKEMFFSGRAQAIAGGLGGALGAIIGGAVAKKEPQDEIIAAMGANAISIPEILRSEFGNELTKLGRLRVVTDNANADGEISLVVNMYGLGQRQGLTRLFHTRTDFSIPCCVG